MSETHPDVTNSGNVLQIQKEPDQVLQQHHPVGRPFTLAEVFCSQQSPLTHQVLQQGRNAFRQGYEQGDLATVEGRANLFRKWQCTNQRIYGSSQQEYLEKRDNMLY